MASGGEGAPVEGTSLALEGFRQFHENDWQWAARRAFLARHIHAYPGRKVDQLIAMSVVWSNIVFIGNRYGEQLTQKVHQMAEGIDIGEMPSYELVPGAKATKRSATSDTTGQPQKKKFGPRPRFEPVRFVVSTIEDDKQFKKTDKSIDTSSQEETNLPHTSNEHPENEKYSEMELNSSPYVYDPNVVHDQIKSECSNFMTKMEQDYSAKFESHNSSLSKDFRSNVLDTWKGKNSQGRKFGIGFVKPPKKPNKFRKEIVSSSWDQPSFIQQLSASVKENMQNPLIATGSTQIHYTHMLNQSVQSCKANPEYIYVPLKEIPPSNLPKLMKIPSDGFACEVRCQDVYLATGYSRSRNGARAKAAELAIQLLLKPEVKVISVMRRFGHGYREDLVACSSDSPETEFPPALKQDLVACSSDSPETEFPPALKQDEHANEDPLEGHQSSETLKDSSTKPWSELILIQNASNAVDILNDSAVFNKMTVDFKFDLKPPSNLFLCSVYVQDHCVAKAYGNKQTSKYAAAEKAVNIFKNLHQQKSNLDRFTANRATTSLKDIVICGNYKLAVCTLHATAQFNKVPIEYVLEQMSEINWKCQVLINQELVAEAIGNKKTVKHEAANEALMVLKKTQPVFLKNLKNGPAVDAISRNQILGLSNEEAYKQEIKEDNIGNQLLRKMGWTGGGLGKEGGGIAEPIFVKEKFSREGLGSTTINKKITKRDIRVMIKDYAASNSTDNLTFSRELSKEERKHIHEVARKYKLVSKSHGKDSNRYIVVSRKINKSDVLHQLRQGSQVVPYTVVLPD